MKPDATDKDMAFSVMAMDVLSNVLNRADNPDDLGTYLTEEVRNLTGARCVLLIQCLSTPTVMVHRVVSVNPLRQREWAESLAVNRLYDVVHRVPAVQVWHGEEPLEVAGLLRQEGFELSMVFPLNTGEFRVGTMLVLGLRDEEHINSMLSLLNNLSAIVALVLHNATLFEKQERLIQERTAELRDKNESLAKELVERKRVEEALRVNEERYCLSQSVGHVGTWEYNLCTSRFWGSDEAKRLYGFDPNQTDFSTDEVESCILERERVHQALLDLIERGKPYNLEFEIRPRNTPEPRFIASLAEVHRDEQGKPLSVVGAVQDITERKRAEQALHESEARLKEAQRVGRLGSWDWDARTDTITWSEEYYRIYGFDPQQPPPGYEEHLNAYTPESAARLDAAVKRNMQTGEPYELDLELAHTDGPCRWITARSETKRDENGQIVGLRGTAQDITERKRAEEALRQSEERFRRLTENARDMIYRMSLPDGKYEYVSPAALSVVGFSPEEYYATPMLIRQAIHPDWHEYFEEQWANLIKGEMPPTYEYQFIHKSGQVRWLNQRNILVRDDAGTPIAIEGIVTDITERKWAEGEIRRLNEELEQRVIDRTAELEAAIKEHEAFTYSVAHDLRAPLRHIDGFLDLLKNRLPNLDEKSLHYMTTISNSATRMGALVDDLLSFSRMGRSGMSKQRVDLNGLVREVIVELEPEAKGRKIHWHVADLPLVTGDRAMLRVVLINLISNALKFTQPREQAEIEIGCMPDREKETTIFVRDNGVGFDTNYADKLFGVFQRLHRADEFEGTGIGLANVRRIINRHGGRTWAEGAVNQGATFYFSLPQLVQGGQL